MAGVRQLLGQRPEGLDDLLGVAGDRFGEVAPRGRDRADQAHRALAAVHGVDPPGPLVEGGQTRGQIGRVALFHRHLPESARDLAQGLRPAAGGVRQHHHVVALVSVVFGDGDAHVDGGLAGHHRHVGGVGDQQGALHQGAAGVGVLELGKAVEHVHQLVAPLAAAHIDDDVCIRPARHLMLHHGLAGAEGAGHRALAALEQGEEGVQDALPGDQRFDPVIPALVGAWPAHRPAVVELELLHPTVRQAYPGDGLVQGVLTLGGDLDQLPLDLRRYQDPVQQGLGLLHTAQAGAADDRHVRFEQLRGHEGPQPFPIQGGGAQAPRYLIPCFQGHLLQRTLHPVEDAAHQPRTQLHREGPTQPLHRFARAYHLGGFVDLRQGLVPLQADHLTVQPQMADAHLFAVADAGQANGDDRAVDLADGPVEVGVRHCDV